MIGKRIKERSTYLKNKERDEKLMKKELTDALKENKPLPHHLRADAKKMLDEMIYNIEEDDTAVFLPPKIAVTTSHDPSSMLKSFSKHMSLVFNGCHLMRGRMSQAQLGEYCVSQGVTHLLILNETKGHPSTLILCKYPTGPTYKFSLFNVKYQRRVKSFGEHAFLVIDGMDSSVGLDLKQNLSLCFPSVKEGGRVVAFINRGGTIAFRHFLAENKKLVKECEFDMKIYKIINSTFDMDGEAGYVVNAFTNTRKEDVLKEVE